MVGALDVTRHLGAQHALRGGMLRVALHLRRHAVLDSHQEGAGIGTIVWAGGPDLCDGHGSSSKGKSFEKPILYTIPDAIVSPLDQTG
ncbi:hypothetical protein GCM10027321_30440 [Massilia terrae]